MTLRWQWPLVWLAASCAALAGCDDPVGGGSGSASSSASGAQQDADAGLPPAARVLRAELARRPGQLLAEDGSSRDPQVRRAVARALARIGGQEAHAGLLRALADEDGQVVAWAAYGLGHWCAGHREPTVRALVAASARHGPWAGVQAADAGSRPSVDPWEAIARAIGRCGAPRSEATLVSWLRQPTDYAIAAIFALGDLATHKRRLREETFVALLKLAAGDAARPPVPEALYPIGRVAHLPPSVTERTLEVARARLEQPGAARFYAVSALSHAGEEAADTLAEVVRGAEDYSAAERAQAARGLRQLGGRGQKALQKLLGELLPPKGPVQATTMIGDDFGVLLTVLSSLDAVGGAAGELRQLASWSVPSELPRAIRLRVSLLRCGAAQLLAERDFASKLLVECDVTEPASKDDAGQPQPGPLARRAIVAAIGMPGAKIRGARLTAWRRHAKGDDLQAREAAIALIGDHGEIKGAAKVLAEALSSKHPGVVAAAAQVIAKVPIRASGAPGKKRKKGDKSLGAKPHPDVVAALLGRLDGKGPTADVETLAAVIDAAGGLLIDEARAPLQTLCSSPQPTVRTRAQRALTTILGGNEKVECRPPADGRDLPAELDELVTTVTALKLESDAGELELRLDPALAPVAVSRIVELARAGFFRGMEVHRVVPGFVAQFGSPTADGFGAGKRPPLPCETSPARFGPLVVGMALAGRDTGGTQIFVTHASHPHLDGQYAWLGTAAGPWSTLAAGDVIRKVTVE